MKVFNPAVDSTIPSAAKRKAEDFDTKSPVSKKIKLEAVETEEIKQEEEEESPKKKKKKKRHSEAAESEAPESQGKTFSLGVIYNDAFQNGYYCQL